MADSSKIEWTEATWNPVTGCTKVSPGCDHCYAERLTERFHGKGSFAIGRGAVRNPVESAAEDRREPERYREWYAEGLAQLNALFAAVDALDGTAGPGEEGSDVGTA